MLKLFMKSRKGFTLVELMVVVVIIGILVAIAVPVYNNVQTSAQANADKATARTILSAVTMAQSAETTVNKNAPTNNEINNFLGTVKLGNAATGNWTVANNNGTWQVSKNGTLITLP